MLVTGDTTQDFAFTPTAAVNDEMIILGGRALLNINYSSSTSYPVAGAAPNGVTIKIYTGCQSLFYTAAVALGTTALCML